MCLILHLTKNVFKLFIIMACIPVGKFHSIRYTFFLILFPQYGNRTIVSRKTSI